MHPWIHFSKRQRYRKIPQDETLQILTNKATTGFNEFSFISSRL